METAVIMVPEDARFPVNLAKRRLAIKIMNEHIVFTHYMLEK